MWFGVLAVDALDVINPRRNIARITMPDNRASIQVECGHAMQVDPAAFRDQPVLDQHALAGNPHHLFDGCVLVQPLARFDGLVAHLDPGKPGIEAG
jgi:hypothetical protein